MNVNTKNILLGSIFFLLVIVIILATILGITITNKIDCITNNPSTSFGIQPDVSAVDDSNPVKGVRSLSDAQEQCLSDNNCKSFIYNDFDKTMKVVDLKSSKINSPGIHLLTLQMGTQVTP